MASEPTEAGGPAGLAAVDREFQAWQARLARALSPVGFSLAYLNRLTHLPDMPDRQAGLVACAWHREIGQAAYAAVIESADATGGCEPRPEDPRFIALGWQRWPFNVFSRAFLPTERWWRTPRTAVGEARTAAAGDL